VSDPWNWVLLATIALPCAAFWAVVKVTVAEARGRRGPGRLTLWLARKGGGYTREKHPDQGAVNFAERVLSALVFWVPFVLLCWWAEWR